MSSPRGVATVRMALLSLVFALLATALMEPASAGTAAAPEVQDPAGDPAVTNQQFFVAGVSAAGSFSGIDIRSAFFSINGTNLTVQLTMEGTVVATATYVATFNVTEGTNKTSVTLQRSGTGVTPANASATLAGRNVTFSIPLAAINGSLASAFEALSIRTNHTSGGTIPDTVPLADGQTAVDTAGPGLTFRTGPPPVPGDADNDGLNDTCEMRWFNATNVTNNASEDRDNDTLTNGQECALGTDPQNPDSDGDGVPDGTDPFPTDPNQNGNSTGNNTNTTSNTTTTTSASNTTTSRSSSTTGNATTTDDSIDNLDEAIEALKGDLGYLGASGGGLLAVLLLCILALAVRWSL